MSERKSPWGSGGAPEGDPASESHDDPAPGPTSGDETPPPEEPKGPRNPWAGADRPTPPRRSATLEDILRPRRSGGGGGGGPFGGFPRLPERPGGGSWTKPIIGLAVLLWLGFSTTHILGSNEQGIVTTFGKYTRPLGSGMSFTAPWPIEKVTVEDVTSIKSDNIPDSEGEKLMLTSDQNLVNISYLVRWNIKDLKLYTFQLDNPQKTVREVAEAAMRAAVAEVPLKDAMGGSGRQQIEGGVRDRMQAILDAYHSGVQIQGIDIKKTDPPEKVVESFQRVTAAQQQAQQQVNASKQWAQQVVNQAQGSAAEFNKVYEQYKLAPEVTRRRLYYETMERVLSANDKVIVEANGVVPYLPLPEARRGAALAAPAEGGQ